jgi:uncharacterized protein YcfJ
MKQFILLILIGGALACTAQEQHGEQRAERLQLIAKSAQYAAVYQAQRADMLAMTARQYDILAIGAVFRKFPDRDVCDIPATEFSAIRGGDLYRQNGCAQAEAMRALQQAFPQLFAQKQLEDWQDLRQFYERENGLDLRQELSKATLLRN